MTKEFVEMSILALPKELQVSSELNYAQKVILGVVASKLRIKGIKFFWVSPKYFERIFSYLPDVSLTEITPAITGLISKGYLKAIKKSDKAIMCVLGDKMTQTEEVEDVVYPALQSYTDLPLEIKYALKYINELTDIIADMEKENKEMRTKIHRLQKNHYSVLHKIESLINIKNE